MTLNRNFPNRNRNFPGFVIENSTIAVDYWPRQGYAHLTHFFLTHAHSDHTKGLDSTWADQIIHCTTTTKRLMMDLKGIQEKYFVELTTDRSYIMRLDDTETFNVTLIDANHCPGAVMYLFEGYFGTILATGDFRYTPSMFTDTALKDKEIDKCYLDNTYLHQKFADLPSREEATKQIIDLIKRRKKIGHVFLIKIKILGKESLIEKIYSNFLEPIVCSLTRYKRYTEILELDNKMFTVKPDSESFIFLDDNELFSIEEIEAFLKDKQIICIEPTALCFDRKMMNNANVKIPYTDHSSYSEIHSFIKNLRPKRIVPIVWNPLPNKMTTTSVLCLMKYTCKKPYVHKNANEKYRLLLQSSSSTKTGSILNSFHLNSSKIRASVSNIDTSTPTVRLRRRSSDELSPATPEKKKMRSIINITPIPTNNITRRRITNKKEITYETPEKAEKIQEIDDDDSKIKIDENQYPINSSTPKNDIQLRRISAYQLKSIAKEKMETIPEISNEMDSDLDTLKKKMRFDGAIDVSTENLFQKSLDSIRPKLPRSFNNKRFSHQFEIRSFSSSSDESLRIKEINTSSSNKVEKECMEEISIDSISISNELKKNTDEIVEEANEIDMIDPKPAEQPNDKICDDDVDMKSASQNENMPTKDVDANEKIEIDMNESQQDNAKETDKENNSAINISSQEYHSLGSETKMSIEITFENTKESNIPSKEKSPSLDLKNYILVHENGKYHLREKTQSIAEHLSVNIAKPVTKLINELHGEGRKESTKPAGKKDEFFDDLTFYDSSNGSTKKKSPAKKNNKEITITEKNSDEPQEIIAEEISTSVGNDSNKSIDLFIDTSSSSDFCVVKPKKIIIESESEMYESDSQSETNGDGTTFIEDTEATKNFYKFMYSALKNIDEIDPIKSDKNVFDFYTDNNRF